MHLRVQHRIGMLLAQNIAFADTASIVGSKNTMTAVLNIMLLRHLLLGIYNLGFAHV
jgi:hypothetical protein